VAQPRDPYGGVVNAASRTPSILPGGPSLAARSFDIEGIGWGRARRQLQ